MIADAKKQIILLMKTYEITLLAALLALSSCGINNKNSNDAVNNDSTIAAARDSTEMGGLYGIMQIRDTIKPGDPVELKFTVLNRADITQRFCKWHTPFEPLMSKYLDIKDENGLEVDYRGPMAKRIMPPPADSYIKADPGDSLSTAVDLLKAYAISKPSRYTITYVGQNISGLIVKDSVSFVYR
jgi:hypothetical protein